MVTESGAVAAGGNVSINGAFAAGRDIHVGQVTVIADDGPPVGDQAARPGTAVDRCPYPGLAAFGPDEADLFFGRDEDVQAVLDLISRFRLVAVVGSSGSGKSSLINAAIVPRAAAGQLPGGRLWAPVVLRPGPDPLDSLATAARIAAASGEVGAEGTLWVIDQFEEAFDSTVSDAPRAKFLARVVALAQSGSQDRVLLAFRSDFYASLDVNPVLARLIATAQHRLIPLDLDAVEDAVVLPAELVGLRVEPALMTQLRQEVGANPNSQPLLGYALRQTWSRRRNGWLTLAAYVETGGIAGALERGADRAWRQLSEPQQQTARRMLLRLSHLDDRGVAVRRRRAIADLITDLDDQTTVLTTLNLLASGRLLTVIDDPSVGPAVEIAHESLLREWPLLHNWLREDQQNGRLRDELVTAVDAWIAHGHDPGFLLPALRLAPIDAWQRATRFSLTASERRFLSESRRRARRQRRLRRSLPVLVGLVVLALGVASVAVRTQHRADQARRVADALQTAASARSAVSGQRDLGMLLALAAYRAHRDPSTLGTLLDTVATIDGPLSYQHPTPFAVSLASALTPSGAAIVGLSDGGIELVGARGSQPPPRLEGHRDAVGFVVGFGKLIASADLSGTVLVHRHDEAQPLWRFSPPGTGSHAVTALAADETDGMVVAAYGSTIQQYLISEPLRQLPALQAADEVTSMVLDRRSGRLVAATRSGQVQLWRLPAGAGLGRLTNDDDPLTATARPKLALDDRGRLAAVDGTNLYLWDDLTRPVPVRSTTPVPGATSVLWNSIGGQLLLGSADGSVSTWQPGSPPQQLGARYRGLAPIAQAGGIAAVLATNGRELVGLDPGGTVVRWSLAPGAGPATTRIDSFPTNVLAVAWSSTGLIAGGSADGSVRLVSSAGAQLLRIVLPAPIGGLAWRGEQLLIGAGNGAVYSLAGKAGARPVRLSDALGSPIAAIATDPSGAVAAVTKSGVLRVLHPNGAVLLSQQLPAAAHAVAVSSTGLLAVATGDRQASVITLQRTDGSHRRELRGHRLQVDSLAFTPDGVQLISGSDDRSIRLWSTTSGREVARLLGHTDMIQALAVSPDGKLLASSGQDGTLRLWSLAERSEIGAPLVDKSAFVASLAASPDGQHLVAANGNVVDRWPFADAGWAAAACELADRNLTSAEWQRYAPGIRPSRLCG